jgi:hypothetical protein
MNTAQAGHLVENLGSYNGLRFFRKHFYRFLHVFVASTVGFQVQDAVGWVTRMDVSPEPIGHIDHEQRQMRRLRAPRRGDVHEVFQAPVLFGITEVQLDLEPQAIRVHEGRSGQCLVTAEQDDMGLGRRTSPARCGCIDAALSALQWVGGIANMLKCP